MAAACAQQRLPGMENSIFTPLGGFDPVFKEGVSLLCQNVEEFFKRNPQAQSIASQVVSDNYQMLTAEALQLLKKHPTFRFDVLETVLKDIRQQGIEIKDQHAILKASFCKGLGDSLKDEYMKHIIDVTPLHILYFQKVDSKLRELLWEQELGVYTFGQAIPELERVIKFQQIPSEKLEELVDGNLPLYTVALSLSRLMKLNFIA